MSRKRFIVLGGPGGYLATAPAGFKLTDPRWRRWQILFAVNRPLTPRMREAALAAALRSFELVP